MTLSARAYVAVHSENELKASSLYVAGKESSQSTFEAVSGLPGKRMAQQKRCF